MANVAPPPSTPRPPRPNGAQASSPGWNDRVFEGVEPGVSVPISSPRADRVHINPRRARPQPSPHIHKSIRPRPRGQRDTPSTSNGPTSVRRLESPPCQPPITRHLRLGCIASSRLRRRLPLFFVVGRAIGFTFFVGGWTKVWLSRESGCERNSSPGDVTFRVMASSCSITCQGACRGDTVSLVASRDRRGCIHSRRGTNTIHGGEGHVSSLSQPFTPGASSTMLTSRRIE